MDRSGGVGFSLLELLAVLAVVGIVSAVAVPSVNAVLRGSRLTQGAQLICSQLDLARQTALSKNHSVEVRFYQYGDPETPGESPNSPGTGSFRAVQIFDIQDSGAAVPLSKVQVVPPSIVIDSGAVLSSIIGSASPAAVPASTTGAALNFPIPRAGTQYNCTLFRFLPDGSTNLSLASQWWFLTLHNLLDGRNLDTPPANYFTIQIDANNGHIKTFRP